MEISVHENKSNIFVLIKQGFREKRMIYNINYLTKEIARKKANTLMNKLKFFPDLNWQDVDQFLDKENKEIESHYINQGKGITVASGNKCFSVYFKFLEGPSPYFRVLFSKYQFGETRAYNLAKRFQKDYSELRKKAFATDKDIERLIEKYDKIKMQQELINLETERRNKLQEYRAKKI